MRGFLLFLCGVAGGVLGGLGLGGGTLMIPLLTVAMRVEPSLAAEVNLLSFIPMSIVATFLHVKRNMIEGGKALFLSLFALVGAVVAALVIKCVSGDILKKSFGWFLIAIGTLSAVLDMFEKGRNDTQK